ncbi:MAG: COX15/CtaA family protein [Pseudomonadales bacterium]|nr:COX15/CtaA family protein [Pseudomonadales bacterium]MBO6566401.1 COX15/CtaA family protein [Pseudomonadales bacterium]MBO6597661.1 COX15/CtaA family protein [Pseudomonadales bacterium]MBO6658018.1 COX15/CtaA family protein [Pseudomonadales bacterium]MBO6703976.1 COX15/CtaA family protein [Pseudomonadales bacterium]
MNSEAKHSLHLVIWLAFVCLVVYLMIVVGGVTRLTQSGLSMVDWRPIMGVVPPLTSDDWQQTFEAYKQYPEYQKINKGMSLAEFKQIFYWEYGHRVLGRLIGIIYFLPFVVFLAVGRVEKRWQPRLWMALLLGGLQGLMGWYMVKSGLVDVPYVSHYRLAAHLMLAMLILAFLFWLILDMLAVKRPEVSASQSSISLWLLVLLVIQLVLGAFTAGLDAGYGFNTWPLMHGQFLADAALMMSPFWLNFVENGVMIQFVHRWIGALLVLGILWFAFKARGTALFGASMILLGVTLVQFALGVTTLLYRVPVVLGSLHQAVACLMLLALVYCVYLSRRPREAQ